MGLSKQEERSQAASGYYQHCYSPTKPSFICETFLLAKSFYLHYSFKLLAWIYGPTIDNLQRLPRITLFQPHLLYFCGKHCGQIYLRDDPCLVWDFPCCIGSPGCMGFTDWLLTNQISRNLVCMSWSLITGCNS